MPDATPRQRLERLDSDIVTPGLGRITTLLRGLGDPHLRYPSTIVAGTNGKGSVVAMLGTIGRVAGVRVGTYTSPHVRALEERFQIDGHPISGTGLDAHLDEVLTTAERLLGRGALDGHPSYFEILTAAAFRYFAEARVDLAVLEVGLGGRLDATHVTMPRVAVITPISIDHTDWLGHDLATIADEKFAVVPESGIAVIAPQAPVVLERIRQRASERNITLLETEQYSLSLRTTDERLRHTFDLDGWKRFYRGMEVALPGRHQVDNARCAILACEVLDRHRMRIGADAIWSGLRKVDLPGRCQWVTGPPRAVLDGAHNPAGAESLASYLSGLRSAGSFESLHMVFGALKDKDLAGMAAPLFAQADTLVTTTPRSARAANAADALAAATPPVLHEAVDDPEAALSVAMQHAGPADLICVTGSLYLLGQLAPLLEPDDHE